MQLSTRKMKFLTTAFGWLGIGLAAFFTLSVSPSFAQNIRDDDPFITDPATGLRERLGDSKKEQHPKLDSGLNQVVRAYKKVGMNRARIAARNSAIAIQDDAVKVIIELPYDPDLRALEQKSTRVAQQIQALGGKVVSHHEELLSAFVPISKLTAVADLPDVKEVSVPSRPQPLVTSEAVTSDVLHTAAWYASDFKGDGVKVGIIDVGFRNYAQLQGTELPKNIQTLFFTPYPAQAETHGTAVAEIIHDMAPKAQIFLTDPPNECDLGIAVDWLISQGVQVINHSVGWNIALGPLDGTGKVNRRVDKAAANGSG